MRILIIGLGLIGGSLARALSRSGNHEIWGMDRDGGSARRALADGAISRIADREDIARAQLVWVCLHPRATVEVMEDIAPLIAPGAIAADVCGVKESVVSALHGPLTARGVRFVGCHPMAGREFSGYGYSTASLFEGASFIMTPVEGTDPAAAAVLEALAGEAGFGRTVRTDPAHHDRVIAFSSQLAHVVSNAYVKSPTLRERSGFSAGSFQDLTRVARMNAAMWTELFLANAPALIGELEGLMASLGQVRDALARGDEAALYALLEEGSRLKIASEEDR